MSGFLFSSIVAVISAAGYGGVIGLMALESACIPLPSEIIMPFSGFLVSIGHFNLLIVATAGAIGCNIGSTAAYLLGAYGGRKAVLRWGHYVFFGAGEVDRLDSVFDKYGSAAVLVGRLLPVVRTFISLPAGIAKMPFVRFEIYTFIGSWPWCFALAYIGMILGDQWKNNPTLHAVFHQFDWAIGAGLAVALAYYVYDRWRSIHTDERSEASVAFPAWYLPLGERHAKPHHPKTCRLPAQSRHGPVHRKCPLLGVEQTSRQRNENFRMR